MKKNKEVNPKKMDKFSSLVLDVFKQHTARKGCV